MKITWNDISSNIVCSKLTSTEPNPIYKEIYEHLKYWIPSIVQDTKVTINDTYSYIYDSKTKGLLIDYDNIWSVFKSKYDMKYVDIQSLITGYVVSTHNIEVNHTTNLCLLPVRNVVSTHNIEVNHTQCIITLSNSFDVGTHNIEVNHTFHHLN
jgi:hypothetical protein